MNGFNDFANEEDFLEDYYSENEIIHPEPLKTSNIKVIPADENSSDSYYSMNSSGSFEFPLAGRALGKQFFNSMNDKNYFGLFSNKI